MELPFYVVIFRFSIKKKKCYFECEKSRIHMWTKFIQEIKLSVNFVRFSYSTCGQKGSSTAPLPPGLLQISGVSRNFEM